jgi:hypothetical protein
MPLDMAWFSTANEPVFMVFPIQVYGMWPSNHEFKVIQTWCGVLHDYLFAAKSLGAALRFGWLFLYALFAFGNG